MSKKILEFGWEPADKDAREWAAEQGMNVPSSGVLAYKYKKQYVDYVGRTEPNFRQAADDWIRINRPKSYKSDDDYDDDDDDDYSAYQLTSSTSARPSTSGMFSGSLPPFPSTTSDRSFSGHFFGTPSSAPAIPVQQNEPNVQAINLVIEQSKKIADLAEMLKRKTITMQDVNVARQRLNEINELLGRITVNQNDQSVYNALAELKKSM